jgi:site-specific recombinase XerD
MVNIPLCQPALKLLGNLSQYDPMQPICVAFSDPKTNEFLKQIAQKKKIKKSLTTHVARHTFATIYLQNTKDLATLSKLLGHASVTQTMIYVHISDADKQKGIATFNEFNI